MIVNGQKIHQFFTPYNLKLSSHRSVCQKLTGAGDGAFSICLFRRTDFRWVTRSDVAPIAVSIL